MLTETVVGRHRGPITYDDLGMRTECQCILIGISVGPIRHEIAVQSKVIFVVIKNRYLHSIACLPESTDKLTFSQSGDVLVF